MKLDSIRKKFKEINETLTVINGKLNYINDLDLKVVEEWNELGWTK